MLQPHVRRVGPDIPMASMADIAFLLIAFFLVTTTMSQDKGLSLQLPPAAETKEVSKKNICNIWINARDQIAYFEREVLVPIEFSTLRADVERRLQENEKLIMSLKSERGASYRMFVDVLDELKLAGATRISIANPEE